jgi:5'-nucleotidase
VSARRALITNDDGIDSPGLAVLAAAARRAGYQPMIVAPSWDSSGASASLSATEADGRVLIEERASTELGGPAMAIEAAPAFIVRAAMAQAFGHTPDVVLSGVNHGANLGHVVLHSGTVGAALTAATYGLPSLAASLEVGDRWHWDTAATVLDTVLLWLDDLDSTPCLNLNVPPVAPDRFRGIAAATLAPFGAVQSTVTEAGAGWVRVRYQPSAIDHQAGTDAALLAEGYATVTPLRGIDEGSFDLEAALARQPPTD